MNKGGRGRHVSAAYNEDSAVADLPSEEEGAAGLDGGELGGGGLDDGGLGGGRFHWGRYIGRKGYIGEGGGWKSRDMPVESDQGNNF